MYFLLTFFFLFSLFFLCFLFFFFFFFNDTATTEIYTLSLHDALPILPYSLSGFHEPYSSWSGDKSPDRKSTRLNSSHPSISYAVFCLKKKKNKKKPNPAKKKTTKYVSNKTIVTATVHIAS